MALDVTEIKSHQVAPLYYNSLLFDLRRLYQGAVSVGASG